MSAHPAESSFAGPIISDPDQHRITQAIQNLRQEIDRCAHDYGRDPKSIELMAVTKTQPWPAVQAAVRSGIRLIGENRVQEVTAKLPQPWPYPATEVHFIGHLQKNKIKKIVPFVSVVQSLDDPETARFLEAAAGSAERSLGVFLEVNTSGETAKSGVESLADLRALAKTVVALPHLRLMGLMTVGPLTDDPDRIKAAFDQLAQWRDEVRGLAGGEGCNQLSMGMSNDWRLAVAAGSTLVRLGTAIFGARI